MDDHLKVHKNVERKTKMVLQDKLALNEKQNNPQLKAQLAEQIKGIPQQQPGDHRQTIVVYCNDVELKKKKKKKKKRNKKKNKKKRRRSKTDKKGRSAKPGPVAFDPAAEGYQTVDAVVFQEYAGIPFIVPIDFKEPQLVKVNGTKMLTGALIWKEVMGGPKPPQVLAGQLIKNGNNLTIFVANGIDISHRNPVLLSVITEADEENTEGKQARNEVPLSGTVTIENDGSLQFAKRQLKSNEGRAVVAEGCAPEAVLRTLIKDAKTGGVIFLSSDDYGVEAALEDEKSDDKPEVSTQQLLCTILNNVVKRGGNLQAVRGVNSAKGERKIGVLVQNTNAPLFVPIKVWKRETKNAFAKFASKKPDPLMVNAEAVKEILRRLTDTGWWTWPTRSSMPNSSEGASTTSKNSMKRRGPCATGRRQKNVDVLLPHQVQLAFVCLSFIFFEGRSDFYKEVGRIYDIIN